MKISCSNNFAIGETITERMAFVAESGFDAIELVATPDQMEEMLPEVINAKKSINLPVSALCALHRGWLIDPNPDARQAAMEDISRLIKLAGDVGAIGVFVIPILGYTIALPGGPSTGRTQDEDRELLANLLGELGRKAEKNGTKVLLEVINRYESPIANRLSESATIIKASGSKACQLHADFFHMNIEESNLAEALYSTADLLGYVHLADSMRTYPGLGHTNYLELFRMLVKIGYDGYVTVDAGDSRVHAGKILPNIVRYVRGMIGLAEEYNLLSQID